MIYLQKHHEYRINIESEFEEGTGATDDRQAREEDNDVHFFSAPCGVKATLRFDGLPVIPDTDSAQLVSTWAL